jgi:L-2-hydroxyglutarate oxidase LhgO
MLVNCAGLHSDRVAQMAGIDPPVKIVPFRGEYYTLTTGAASLVKGLIYPVPDPRFPFLGVHFTRRVDGSVEVGPNAVLALGREHYRGSGPNWNDLWETLTYSGFRKLVGRFWRTGAAEAWRSAWRSTYARSARSLVPAIRTEHLQPGGAGIRAQAVTPDGALVDDFSIVETDRSVHVLNAPSPAATASLAIGEHIAALVEPKLRD